jgi:hypothetical protein
MLLNGAVQIEEMVTQLTERLRNPTSMQRIMPVLPRGFLVSVLHLIHIYFRLKYNLLYTHITWFGCIQPSSGVLCVAKIVALYVKILYPV